MQEAENLGKIDEQRLLKNRRLVLLVDLDQTLIHTTNENIPAKMKDVVTSAELKQYASQYNFQAAVECSAKDRKGLNQVFLSAFKTVF